MKKMHVMVKKLKGVLKGRFQILTDVRFRTPVLQFRSESIQIYKC